MTAREDGWKGFYIEGVLDFSLIGILSNISGILAGEGIGEKRLDSILKVTDLSKMKLDKDGNLEGVDELKKAINDEWGEFKTTVTEKGAVVEKPLVTGKATKTKDEIMAIKDTRERQQAIAENHQLFGF